MKNVIIGFLLSTFSLAQETEKQSDNPGNWTDTFQTLAGPIVHTPNFVRMGFMTVGEKLTMSKGSRINDFAFPADLTLRTDFTRDQFVTALTKGQIYSGK